MRAAFLAAAVVLALSAPAMAAQPQPARGDPTDRLPLTPGRHIAFDTGEGTWMSLTSSPDGRTLVFDLLGDLYAMPASGGEAHALTRGFPFDSQPTFSLDGRWIAFTSDRSGAENLWVMRSDRTGLRQLSHTDDVTEYVSPAWSPDGASVYVSDYRPDLTAFQLWRYDLAGGAPVQITHAKTTPDQPEDRRVSALGPAPSPDGRSPLAYAKTAGLDPSTLTIDQFAYQNLLDVGEILGPRTYSTGTAIFSFNEFQSLRQVEDVLSRYRARSRRWPARYCLSGCWATWSASERRSSFPWCGSASSGCATCARSWSGLSACRSAASGSQGCGSAGYRSGPSRCVGR